MTGMRVSAMEDLTENDVDFETMRAGGPGGQNVDRRATAVRLRVRIEDLPLEDEKKAWVKEHLPPRHRTQDGEILVENADTRSQQKNRRRALDVANEQIQRAVERGRQARKQQQRKRRIERGRGGGDSGEEDIRETQKRRRRRETTDDLLEDAYEEAPDLIERYLETDGEDEDTEGDET